MKKLQSVLLLLFMVLVLSFMPKLSLAANDYKINGLTGPSGTPPNYTYTGELFEVNGSVSIPLQVVAPGSTINYIQIVASSTPVITKIDYPTDANGDAKLTTGTAQYLFIDAAVNPNLPIGSHPAKIAIYESGGDVVTLGFSIRKTSPPPSSSAEQSDDDAGIKAPEGQPTMLALSPVDSMGRSVPAPKGNYGESIQVRVPILNRGGIGGKASRILVMPQISATLDNFPFVIDSVDYTRKLDDMLPGDIREVQYDFKLSKEVTAGTKEVKFNLVYYNTGISAYETAVVSVFVTVIKGKEGPLTGAEGETITSTPKLIIEGYTITPGNVDDGDSLFAGEQFSLSMRIRNTSSVTIQNIQVTLTNEGDVILPANSGSNTLYIDKISAGEMVERSVVLQSVPDIEPKSHGVSIKFGYESATTLKAYEAVSSVSMSIKQRIRMRIDDPVYEEMIMAGGSSYVHFNIYNMGKSTVNNLMVEIEGEGLRLEEPFYGGNIGSGQSTSADFAVIAETPGEIEGVIIVSYEDSLGEVTKVEKPIKLMVEDMNSGMGDMAIDPKTGLPINAESGMVISMDEGMAVGGKNVTASKISMWLIALIIVAVAGLVIGTLMFVKRRKRNKFLEEK